MSALTSASALRGTLRDHPLLVGAASCHGWYETPHGTPQLEHAREPSPAGEVSVESTGAAEGGVSRGNVNPDVTVLSAVLSKGIWV